MQAAVMYKPGDIRLEDVPKPAAKKGEGVRGYDVGELVGVAPMLPCRVCDQCLTGNSRAAATTIISAAGATGLTPNSSPRQSEIFSRRRRGAIRAPSP